MYSYSVVICVLCILIAFFPLCFSQLQVCTGVMMHGYGLVKKLCADLKEFMRKHNFTSIEDFRGYDFDSSFKNIEPYTRHDDILKVTDINIE